MIYIGVVVVHLICYGPIFFYAQLLTLPIPVMCLINGKLNKRFCVFVRFQENQSVEGERNNLQAWIHERKINCKMRWSSTIAATSSPHSSLIFRHFHEKFTREFRTQAVYNNHNDAWLLIWRGFNVQVDFLFRNFYFLSSF